MQIELRKCRATLSSLRPKVGGSVRDDVKRIETRIAHVCALSEAGTEDQIWEVYRHVGGLEEDVRNLVEDMKWR